MTLKAHLAFGLGVALLGFAPGVAMAQEPPIYPYATENFCPAGLQPIQLGGVICCGVPTRTQSYASMMRHPVAKRQTHKVRRYVERIPTEKGIPTGKGLGD